MLVLIKRVKTKYLLLEQKKFQNKMFWSKLIIHQKALYDIFCEERIAIAFVIPGKPSSKKKIQY